MENEEKQIILLEDAKRLGLSRYFTGKPCKYGHIAERIVSTRTCVLCKNKREIENSKKYKERILKRRRAFYWENRDELLKRRREYTQDYKPIRNKSIRDRRRKDPVFMLQDRLRARIKNYFKRTSLKKSERTQELIGCSFEEFKVHIEKQFQKGMNWENRDKWHIDHVVPISSAKTIEDVIALNHFTNLRPLWAEDNLKKSDKMEYLL